MISTKFDWALFSILFLQYNLIYMTASSWAIAMASTVISCCCHYLGYLEEKASHE